MSAVQAYTPTPEDFAHSRLIAYAAYQWPGYRDAKHHRMIARKLEAVERGEIDRLMIFMPPRHGKSMLASEYFPAWYLGRNPDHYVIAATYAQDLADDFGRKVRDQISDPQFTQIFPGVRLRDDSRAVKRFQVTGPKDAVTLAQDGAYFAVGAGGPLTGRGAHLLMIDDPLKNREEADSENARKKLRDWYTSTAYTRLMPGGRVVVIQTRWHEDDLSGWLMAEHQHEGWDILSLPAIDHQGAALWPEQYPIDRLEQIRRTLPPRDWSALFQQAPTPDTGDYFRAEWFRAARDITVAEARESMRVFGASDYAVTDAGGDWTVHAVFGIDRDDNPWLLDLWRQQATSDVWVDAWCDLVLKWRPLAWAEETGQIKSGVGPFRDRVADQRKAWTTKELFPTRGDKQIRASSYRGLIASKGLRIPAGLPGRTEFISEHLRFPAGVHDDQVDAGGLAGQLIDKMFAKSQPRGVDKPADRGYKRAGVGPSVGSWRV